MYRVMLNLLDNASKFSPSGSVIQVRLEQRGDVLGVSVRDQGPGFPPEALPQVFDRFYRADSARVRTDSTSVGGSGLGLAIVRQIIEAHGGMVEASNSAEGGALVRVQFPVFALKPD
ncbi:MAG: sensor histidine kinase [Synechococcaceae cyanobacterium SM2_3_60]|nr:sensor histidine kinase [Synechococcaceae cyanobacterium SM2_3_60]